MATGPPIIGPKPPDVTRLICRAEVPASNRCPRPAPACALRPKADAPTACALGHLLQDSAGPGETASPGAARPPGLLHRPFEPGLDRRGFVVDVGPVQARPRLDGAARRTGIS